MSDLADDPYAVAIQRGQVVSLPESNELFVDIDSEPDFELMKEMIRVMRRNGEGCSTVRASASSTPGHLHVRISLARPVTAVERIAYQACLGSDRMRELLSLLRVRKGYQAPPTLFFEHQMPVPTRAIRIREEDEDGVAPTNITSG